MTNQHTFEDFYQQNKRRIHYQIHKLNIHDPHKEYFQEGLCAMWNAYQTYQPDKGVLSTYFNYTIRNRIIDLLRQQNNYLKHIQTSFQDNTIESLNSSNNPILLSSQIHTTFLDNSPLWKQIKSQLTLNQWKWIYYAVIVGMSLKQLSIQENTTVEAVKSWARQARKKLNNPEFQNQLLELLQG
ncbi:sigma-70 family RNA polymerase sigma factor [Virgibacillus sp. C22-A2]|uniref:Sigma-70 family RNA polymerase sigma factor n=1 Tax=Virgibacillus tibetensis TaxID=3042313 RepID=A0ABU6KLI9_9BACI|nr:sigma-70 family RNA polymerase sigma factor [Virgibacillus sp. C22-A2]